MKNHTPSSAASGNTLLVVIMLVGILTLALGCYLALTSGENQMVIRSRSWHSALPMAEAGVEEALSQLNKNSENLTADGWTQSGTNTIYSKTRYFGNDYYNVSISGALSSGVTIGSTGYVRTVTIRDHAANTAYPTSFISRNVQVTAQQSSIPPPAGLVAKNSLAFGGNLGVDSYDTRSLATSSTNSSATGMYDPSRRTALAFVGCVGSAALTLTGNEHIYGYATSGVGALTPTTSGSASIGLFSLAKGVSPGHATNNYFSSIPDVAAPYNSASAPPTTANQINGHTYDYVLSGGNYIASTLTSGATLYVTNSSSGTNNTSTLYVTGDFTLSKVVFAAPDTNGNSPRLDLYVGGTTIPSPSLYNELADAGHTASAAVAPAQFRVLGLNSCTTMNLGGSFVGVIYAPYVKLKATGNGQFYGAATVKLFDCRGTFDFHYDTSLTNLTSNSALTILSWAEQ